MVEQATEDASRTRESRFFWSPGLAQFQPFSRRTVRAGDRREATPIAPDLVTAIRNEDAQAVRNLIDNGADVNARDGEGNTPLILASFYASPECVALLLEKGADVNAANKAGVTALIRAATSHEKTRLLVGSRREGPGAHGRSRQHAADPGSPPRRQFPDRPIAARTERAIATERNNAGIAPIIAGAASGDLETVRLLLDAGAKADDFPKSNDPRATDIAAGFRTPLMWAAYNNDVPMVRLLLDHGADPNRSTVFRQPVVARLLERRLRGGGIA